MERILVLVGIVLVYFMMNNMPALAIEQLNLSTLITAQNVKYETCTKVFNTDHVSLFNLTIAAINANRFQIDEIQSKSGYVLFTAVNKQFMATVANVNTNQGIVRITPVDSNYFFQPGIVLNIFKYIELNINNKADFFRLN